MQKNIWIVAIACLLFNIGCKNHSFKNDSTRDQAWNEFANPEDSTRTKVWWFHGETETTREGITADLEAYKRVGVGGVVYYDQVHGKGENAFDGLSPEWWDMLHFAASEAKRIGLSFEANLSSGYVAGGPWITKELSMQRMTASDTIVRGGEKFRGKLPLPNKAEFWDVAVLAFPINRTEWESSLSRPPKISCSLPQLNAQDLIRADAKLVDIPPQPKGKSVYVTLDFGENFTARSISYKVRQRGKATTGAMNVPGPSSEDFYGASYIKQPDLGELEVSTDGVNFTKVCDLKPIYQAAASRWNQKTISFPSTTSRYFRLNLHDWCLDDDSRRDMPFGNIVLSSRARMDQWEEKVALYSEYITSDNTPIYMSDEIIDSGQIVDLTSNMDKDGTLEWNIPEGDWLIMRFAHEPTGGPSKHGRANMKGLECDKLSSKAVEVHWNNYFKLISDSLQKAGIPLEGMTMDSHEAGSQNWTSGFENEFLRRKGYAITKYLPAMMGYIVGSKEETSGFLYDLRRTIADAVSDEYYGTLQRLCDEAGVNLTAQATGNGLSLVSDNIQAKGRVQKPQGEFWAKHTHGSYDIKETSSAAHIYGKNIASAEAYTDVKFSESLAEMKNLADFAYACHVNEFVICASAYQPWLDKYPGNTGGGRHYCLNRNNTVWEYSKEFWDYQARCAGLMRKGLAVVDLCIYIGDNPPVKLLTHRLPEIPYGYDFDVSTAEALINRMQAKDGEIVLPDGMSYRMLVLQKNCNITLDALRHIASLVKNGVPLYGDRPEGSTSLRDFSYIKEYDSLVNQIWGKDIASSGKNTFGKGNVYWGVTLEEALKLEEITPDFSTKNNNKPTDKIYFSHRKLADADIYFINNHSPNMFNETIDLRTSYQNVEYWDPNTGNRFGIEKISSADEYLKVRLALAPQESGFIVVSNKSITEGLKEKPRYENEKISSIEGEWNVYFDPKWGGPGEVVFDSLNDWAKNSDPRIRYYSGTAVYRKEIELTEPNKDEQIVLRFDNLSFMGRVSLNGKEITTVWCSPWEVDITPFIRSGKNSLEVKVVNSLTNRMIGDASLPQEKRFTYAYPEIVKATDKLVPSGIIDNVSIVHRPIHFY